MDKQPIVVFTVGGGARPNLVRLEAGFMVRHCGRLVRKDQSVLGRLLKFWMDHATAATEFPIAVLKPNSLMGGRNAGLHSPRRFRFNIADYYQRGGFDDAILYDASGKKCQIDRIELTKPHWIYPFLKRADNFFIFPDSDPADMVSVDFALTVVDDLTVAQLKKEMLDVAIENPNWWKRHSTKIEIDEMFLDCETWSEVIESIGVLDAPGKERLPSKSLITFDMR